jgi:hypothetical protein
MRRREPPIFMKLEAMLWVLILVSLAFAIASPRFRKYGLVVVGVFVAALVAVIVLLQKNDVSTPAPPNVPAQHSERVDFERSHVDKLDKEDPDAKSRIDVSELRFDQIRPSADLGPASFESIRARLYNDSTRFTLTDYAYYLVIQDCVAKVCTTIYDQRGLASISIPPAQARDVVIEIRASETRESPTFKLVGTPNIILSPTGTRAYKSALVP